MDIPFQSKFYRQFFIDDILDKHLCNAMDLFRPNDSFIYECRLNSTANADDLRFTIVGIFGSVVAMTSILSNVLLFYVFSTSRRLRRQNYANPVLLALFDIIVSFCYMLLLPVQVTAYRFMLVSLIKYWVEFVRFGNCIQHICVTICNFLLVIASLERFFANSPDGKQKSLLVFLVHRKVAKVISIFLLAFLFKGTLLFETAIEDLPKCGELDRYVPVLINHMDPLTSARFWIRKISTVLIPFFTLFYCNCRIVMQLHNKAKESQKQSLKKRSLRGSLTSSSIRKHYYEKKGVRTATKTLVLVVGCYLLSNFLSTFINFWEFSDPQKIQDNYYHYLIISDVASLLTIVGCVLRLPIYCISDVRIRKAVGRALLRCRVKALPMEVRQNHLDKWSIVVVSNSLRSNLTGMNNLFASQEGDSFMSPMDDTNHIWLMDIQEEDLPPERKPSRFRSIMADL
uniref:G_PROTEIN_RECEP_F1_2 domain-containing protein n=1 Tax=Heterorhabditis bacteriophora TaxID=37862 RepID=A0A1I7XNR0_HETBA